MVQNYKCIVAKKKKKLFREIRNNFNVENFHNMDGTLDVGVVRRLGNLSPTCENLNPHHFRCDDSPKYRVLAILPDFFSNKYQLPKHTDVCLNRGQNGLHPSRPC